MKKYNIDGALGRRQFLKGSVFAGIAAGAGLFAEAGLAEEPFPNKPITILVPWAPGGGTSQTSDVISKIAASENLSPVPMTLDHRPGASGLIGTALVADKRGDPYYFMPAGGALLLQTVIGDSPVHPVKDLTPLALSAMDTSVILTAGDSKYKSLQQVIDELKKTPGSVTLAEAGTTGWDGVATNLLQATVGIQFNRIPFNSGAEVHAALLGGQVAVASRQLSNAKDLLQSGDLRALAVFDAERNTLYPDVPTIREVGYDVVTNLARGWFAPAGLKPEEVHWYEVMFKKVNDTKAWTDYIATSGGQSRYLDSAGFTAFIEKTMADIEVAYKKLGLIKA